VPSPNVHNQLVGAPDDVSVNCTASGALPEVGVALNVAVGAGSYPEMDSSECQ